MGEPLLQICTLSLDGRVFALPVSEVREVVRELEVTPVPLAPAAVSGLVNLRGLIATAVDLRRRLGAPGRAPGQGVVNVVVNTAEGPVCLLVDDVGDVIEIDPASIARPPETLPPAVRELVRGICKPDDDELELVLLLDTARACDASGAPARLA